MKTTQVDSASQHLGARNDFSLILCHEKLLKSFVRIRVAIVKTLVRELFEYTLPNPTTQNLTHRSVKLFENVLI